MGPHQRALLKPIQSWLIKLSVRTLSLSLVQHEYLGELSMAVGRTWLDEGGTYSFVRAAPGEALFAGEDCPLLPCDADAVATPEAHPDGNMRDTGKNIAMIWAHSSVLATEKRHNVQRLGVGILLR